MKLEDQLAFSIASSPNTFALLMGSGISRPAKIPTGWEILNDLITQIAAISGEELIEDKTLWFQNKYGLEPSYSNVLEKVAPTPAERTLVVKKYFESSNDEKTGKPTAAHKAIARLVKNGYLKVIITTNFDRLMEQALAEQNIVPTIIRSDSDLDGALPIIHSPCTILKVNGDYLDSRIKNTSGELSSYEPNLTNLIKRILDEYGLMTVGWSGQWDTALYDLVKSCQSRRFSNYWLSRGTPSEHAKDLIASRAAYEISIDSADVFLPALFDKVMSVSKIKATHPVSLEILIETAKDYLVDEVHRIKLHDLIVKETELLISKLSTAQFSVANHISGDDVKDRLDAYFAATTPLAKLFQLGAMWSKETQYSIFVESFNRLTNHCCATRGGATDLISLHRLPLTILLYVSGISGFCNGSMGLFNYLLNHCVVPKRYNDETTHLLETLNLMSVYAEPLAKGITGYDRHKTAQSDQFGERLWTLLPELASNQEAFNKRLDYFEYLLGFKYACDLGGEPEVRGQGDKPSLWGPIGSFAWRGKDLPKLSNEEIERMKNDWIGFKSGLFKNDAIFKTKKEAFDHFIKQVNWRW